MRNLKLPKSTDRFGGRAQCTTWILPEVWRALRLAAVRLDKPVYLMMEDALRRHPAIKREIDAAQS